MYFWGKKYNNKNNLKIYRKTRDNTERKMNRNFQRYLFQMENFPIFKKIWETLSPKTYLEFKPIYFCQCITVYFKYSSSTTISSVECFV